MANSSSEATNILKNLSWIKASLFEPVFKEIFSDYRQTKGFKFERALGGGENYATLILRLKVEVELNDGATEKITLILKTAHESEIFYEMMKNHNVFETESIMYRELIPEFEKLYQDVGVKIKFGPQFYTLDTHHHYILLEDLKPRGFINVNRLEGLDMEHTHAVLKKLAQWHAVSAVRVACKGSFSPQISQSYFKEENLAMMKGMFAPVANIQLECLRNFNDSELYYEKLSEQQGTQVERLLHASKVDLNDFNVLNHGDCWSNNVMFKHDALGNIQETCLIDFQMTKYGSPAQDLYYFLLSSTKYELKIKHFDYFIKYYYNELVEHLKLLNYNKKMPTLKGIHIMLHKYNAWALSTVGGVMAAALLDPQDNANLDNFFNESDVGTKLKIQMYSNPRYRKHCEMIYPWLFNRGAI